jgi:hypothetical protein
LKCVCYPQEWKELKLFLPLPQDITGKYEIVASHRSDAEDLRLV